MHPEDHPVSLPLARALIAGQAPDLGALPLRRVSGGGTDNVLYRLGPDLVARFPRRAGAGAEVERLALWLPLLAPGLPLALPLIRHRGAPGLGYPFAWCIARWLPGRDAWAAPPRDPFRAAGDLAEALRALQALPAPRDAPVRGAADQVHDILKGLGPSIAAFRDEADPGLLRALVAEARRAPRFAGPPRWVHGDLHPLNILTHRGRLSALIDWGGLGLGDPAMDLMPAWTLFDAPARAAFHHAMAPDPGAWARGRALALAKAVMAIPYYRTSNPLFCAVMRKVLDRVLAEAAG